MGLQRLIELSTMSYGSTHLEIRAGLYIGTVIKYTVRKRLTEAVR